ncbi:MAG: alpha/beta hydrolase [Proteobacteria bacterium]|nr:alpha/beta hydrolase [Pseudomonadota bacterium]
MTPQAQPNPQRRMACLSLALWVSGAVVLVWRGAAQWLPLWLALALLANPLGLLVCGLLARRFTPLPWAVSARAWWREATLAVQVFGWQQPWRAEVHPDLLPPGGGRGVVLVHGLFCNRGFWNHWLPRLRARGTPHVAITLAPMLGDMDHHLPAIAAAVARVAAATGQPPLLVGHSMGGLVIRAWLRQAGESARVHGVVTLGTPHQGAWLARLSPPWRGVCQLRPGSAWLAALAAQPQAARFVCIYSDADQVVFPPASAVLPGAQACLLAGVPHVGLAHDERAWQLVVTQLDG